MFDTDTRRGKLMCLPSISFGQTSRFTPTISFGQTSIYPKMDSLIKQSTEKSKIRVIGQIERTEFDILGIRVEDFKLI